MNFFVYLHRRKSNGKVFYVGKGCRYRHKSLWNRSQHWKNIVAKHGYTIEIVEQGMQEWWAFEMEKDLILRYKDDGLCNRTDGGEGTSGAVLSDEARARRRELVWSDAWRNNLSTKLKAKFSDPEYKRQHIERHTAVMQRPEVKAKLRQKALSQFQNPEARELARQKTIEQFSNPEARKRASEKALARFDTPDKRSKHAQAKPVRCIDNGMEFGTTTLAAEWIASWKGSKADFSQVAKACRGVIRTAYGLRWQYVTQ